LEDFARFIFQFPAEKLGVLLDVGHVYQVGINVSEAVGLFKDRLFDVHIHDAKLSGYYRDATHLPIGKGTIDFPEVAAKLRKTGYDGWLTLEIRGTEKEILESKKRLEQYLSK
jgi:sugar phosphate isomerase/epimerase